MRNEVVDNEVAYIAPDELEKIWGGRLYRDKEARSKKTSSARLGLAIAVKILQVHGMTYAVEKRIMVFSSISKLNK